MKPLKQPENSPLCDPSLVDEMFHQIPEILEHHELFLEQVVSCVNDWHERQTIGDLLVQSVSTGHSAFQFSESSLLRKNFIELNQMQKSNLVKWF